MAAYEVDVEGVTYEVDAPDENTAWAWANQVHRQQAKPAVLPAPTSAKEPTFMEQLEKGNIASRIKAGTILYPEEETAIRKLLQGASSGPLMGAAQWYSERYGDKDFAEKIAKNKREGSVAGSLLQPEAWMMGGPLSKIVGVGKQALGMGAAGAAYAGSSASSQLGEAGEREREEAAMMSGGVSAAIPVVGQAAKKITPMMKDLVNSISSIWSKGGRTFIGQKMVLDQLPVAERAEVLRILQTKGIDTSELGSQLTTSQALGQARVAQVTPTSTYSVGQAPQGRLPQISQQPGIASAQSPSGARVAALEAEIAKMQGGERLNQMAAQQAGVQRTMMDTLSGGRGGPGLPLSGMSADDVALQAASGKGRDPARSLYPTGEVIGDSRLDEIMSRPAVETAERVVGAAEANVPKSMVTQGARPADTLMNVPKQYEKYSLESLANRYKSMEFAANKLSRVGRDEEAGAIRAAKNDLGEWLTKQYPDWALANRMFASQSVPVTRMEVGAELKRKMAQSPNQFLTATENLPAQEQMIRSVTGRPNKGLSDIFNLGQMSKISGLRNEAQIADEVGKLEKLARANLGDEAAFQLPNLLNVWVAVANRVARTTGKATVDDVTRAAADVLSDPNAMRKLLISDAMARNTARSPVTQQTLGRIAPAGLVSGGMMTGGN